MTESKSAAFRESRWSVFVFMIPNPLAQHTEEQEYNLLLMQGTMHGGGEAQKIADDTLLPT